MTGMAEFVLSGQELFGRYARIAYGHALDGKQDYHIYKCIRSFMSNCYCDVPLTYQTENNCHTHDKIVEVVNVIHCGIDENRVIRVARNDIELLPAPDVEPVQQWIPVTERLPGREGKLEPWKHYNVVVLRSHWPTSSYDLCDAPYDEKIVTTASYDSEQKIWHLDWGTSLNALIDIKDSPLNGDYVTHWMPLPEPPKEVET